MQFPNFVTEDGISILDNDSQSQNALSPIDVIDEGIMISFNFVHPLKALSQIDVLNDGISK